MGVGGHRIVERDAGIRMQRADLDAHPVTADGIDDRAHSFQREAGFVGNAAAVLVRALVGGIRQELLGQVAIGGMKLHAVEAGAHGVAGGSAVVGNRLADFFLRHGVGHFEILRTL